MNYRDVFPQRHTLLVVVHSRDFTQALRNAEIAKNAGADGIFLIENDFVAAAITERFPNFWIGVNQLCSPVFAFDTIDSRIKGVWTDVSGVVSGVPDPTLAEAAVYAREKSGWKGLYFGGVAFKYQQQPIDLVGTCKVAKNFMDVVTTSGVGTGSAPDLAKIKTMREALGDFPLAVASGITPENVDSYLPYVDSFLVNTGVSDSHYELNAERVKLLADKIKEANNGNVRSA